jgi:sugar phosphate isomerase/epimerase
MNIITEGLSVNFKKFSFPEICLLAVREGFHHIEITMDMEYVIPGSLSEDTLRKFMELSEKLGITYSFHLPLWSIELASPNPFIRKGSIESIIHSINLIKDLNPECYVLHSTGALASEFTRLNISSTFKQIVNRSLLSFSEQSISEILSRTSINSRKLAIENVEFPFELTRETIDKFNLSICFDTGHLLAGFSGEIPFMDFMKENYDRIVEIHLHDGFHKEENGIIIRKDHLPLGEGMLPIKDFINYLNLKNFRGPLVFEIPIKDAKYSINVLKQKCFQLSIE